LFLYDRRGWCVLLGGHFEQGLLANSLGLTGWLFATAFLLFSLCATNLRAWRSLGFHPPKRRPWRWAAPPSVAPPVSEASGAKMETKESLMRTAIPSDCESFANKPVGFALQNTPAPPVPKMKEAASLRQPP